RSNAAKIPMMAITTNNSMSVKAFAFFIGLLILKMERAHLASVGGALARLRDLLFRRIGHLQQPPLLLVCGDSGADVPRWAAERGVRTAGESTHWTHAAVGAHAEGRLLQSIITARFAVGRCGRLRGGFAGGFLWEGGSELCREARFHDQPCSAPLIDFSV